MSPQKKTASANAKKRFPLQIAALGFLCVMASFAIGINTAGNVQTIQPSAAEGTVITGDMNDDGVITVRDAIVILDIAQGYSEATPEQLRKDPNGDGQLTVDDAVRLLHDIESL